MMNEERRKGITLMKNALIHLSASWKRWFIGTVIRDYRRMYSPLLDCLTDNEIWDVYDNLNLSKGEDIKPAIELAFLEAIKKANNVKTQMINRAKE